MALDVLNLLHTRLENNIDKKDLAKRILELVKKEHVVWSALLPDIHNLLVLCVMAFPHC